MMVAGMTAWTKPEYPGDTVRHQMFQKGDELGDVRIQHYGTSVRVGMFLPGVIECSPGDTPKVWPELCAWFSLPGTESDVDKYFSSCVKQAKIEGWSEYDPNERKVHNGKTRTA